MAEYRFAQCGDDKPLAIVVMGMWDKLDERFGLVELIYRRDVWCVVGWLGDMAPRPVDDPWEDPAGQLSEWGG